MSVKSINEVIVGSILLEPIYVGNTLIVKSGVPISEHLKYTLPKFGITDVAVEDVISSSIDSNILDFDKVKNLSYVAIKYLDINKLILCSKSLVKSIVDSSNDKLLNVLFEYDESTYLHSINVANLAVVVGIKMELSIKQLHYLAMGALLHDIGKVNIPSEIINKPGKLTEEEYDIVKQHPWFGYKAICDSLELSSAVKQIVYQHRENYDGSGYPNKLYGLNSYRLARLVHICDVYEALVAVRPYKKSLPRRTVRKILLDGSGTLFDPILLKLFLDTIPIYMAGETIVNESKVGVVLDSIDKDNPDVYCSGKMLKLEEFESLEDYSSDIINRVY